MAFEVTKIIAILSFWIIMMVFSLLPICIKKFRKITLLMTLINCFTAGLFLATGLVHVLPEANEYIVLGMAATDSHDDHEGHDHALKLRQEDAHAGHDDHGEGGHDHGVSIAHLTLLLGFSAILFIDKVLLNRKPKDSSQNKETNIKNDVNSEILDSKKKMKKYSTQVSKLPSLPSGQLDTKIEPLNSNNIMMTSKKEHLSDEEEHLHANCDHHHPQKTENKPKTENQPKQEQVQKHYEGHTHDHLHVSKDASFFSIIVILFALGLHAFMANLAVGIEENEDTLITLIIAIALHKWSEGLALGIILIKKKFSVKKSIFIIMIVSIFTPLGGLTGLLLESSNQVVKGVLLAISAAAFIYIALAEIIFEEFENPDWKYLKFLLYSLGVGVVMLIFLV